MNLKQTNLVQFSFQVWFIFIFQKWTQNESNHSNELIFTLASLGGFIRLFYLKVAFQVPDSHFFAPQKDN